LEAAQGSVKLDFAMLALVRVGAAGGGVGAG
jgi:hypothetical protein